MPITLQTPPMRALNTQLLLVENTPADDTALPLESSRSGSVLHDRFDASLRWYLPAFTVRGDGDSGFAFAAVQAGVTGGGDPFDTATLTVDVALGDPPDLAAARAAEPGATFRPVGLDALDATLTLVSVAEDGTSVSTPYPATVTRPDPATARLTVALQGPAVVVAFSDLRTSGTGTLTVALSYRVWRMVRTFVPAQAFGPSPGPRPMPGRVPHPVAQDGPQPIGPILWHQGEWVESWLVVALTETTTLPLGDTFAVDVFRPRYTLTASGTTRPIVDVDDLRTFATPRSEYRELTSLGEIPDRYPSLRALYLGQVSGTVVAIPARYGIVRSSSGCQARCDAVVDDAPTTLSGSRFAFTFTVAPIVDPYDLLALRADIATAPEAQGRSLHVVLPSGLDPRTAPVFAGTAVDGATTVVDGAEPHTLVVGVTIADRGDVPAITGVNLFLHRLVVATTPIIAQIAVRLDDAFPSPVLTAVVLGLPTTADSDDVGVTLDDATSTCTVTNAGPLALRLAGLVVSGSAGIAQSPVDVALPATGTAPLPCPAGTATVAVRRRYDLPDPMPEHTFFDYVNLQVQTVESVQHPIGFNATAVDFTASGIARLDLVVTLDDLPGLVVPGITLTPTHRVDSVHITVPIGVVVTGLSATVTATVTTPAAAVRTAELHRDFLADPVTVVTPADLA